MFGKIKPTHINYVLNIKNLGKYRTDPNIDVFIKSTIKDFPYQYGGKMPVSAIKISARPTKISFWEKLLGKRTVTEYFPTGNLSIVKNNESINDVFNRVISKVK